MDTTLIEGYDKMSAEEKIKALEGYEFNEAEYVKKLKQSLSETNSENKKLKDAAKAGDTATARIAELEKTIAKNENIKKLSKLGISIDDAETFADSISGVNDDFFTNLETLLNKRETKVKETILQNQPGLSSGTPPVPDPDKSKLDAFMKGAMGL